MNVLNILKRALSEEKLPDGKTGILLLDIDDTLLKSDSSLLKIYRKLPTDKEEVALTSAEYAKEHVTPETKKYYDYRDFRDPKKVYASIVNGAPLLNNLKVVDAFYQGGYDLGVLTARGCADAVRRAIKTFLKVKDANGNLVKAPIVAANIHCVNDDDYPYPGSTDFEKKQNVLRKYAKEYNYDYVYFIDDDMKNLNALKALKKSDPEIAERLRSINAKKNMVNPIKEEVINELAWNGDKHQHIVKGGKIVDDEMLEAINDDNFKKALVAYFDKIKDFPDYAGKKDAKFALRHMISYGLSKTFKAYEKKGYIIDGQVEKMKEWASRNINDLANSVSYEGNENYEKPKWTKQTLRKKFMAKNLDAINKVIDEAKAKGYTFKDEPKEGHTAKDGDFYYIYGTINKSDVNESVALNIQNLLTEMAAKDVTPEIRKAIINKDYRKALVDYFNNVKDSKTYEKFGDNVKAAFDNMLAYGLNRTFSAEEKSGKIPEGSTKAMKDFLNNTENRNAVESDIGATSGSSFKEYRNAKAKKSEPEIDVNAKKLSDLEKITKRIEQYPRLSKELEDYALTGASIKPFIVDIKRNGKDGIDRYSIPQKLSAIDFDDPEATNTQRRLAPILRFRQRYIPEFIQKEALANMDGEAKKNLNKAETLGELYFEATKNAVFAKYMSRILNSIAEGFREFKANNKDASLEELKTEVDFPYKKFVQIEKYLKNAKIKNDENEFNSGLRKRNKVSVPPEVNKVRDEYITFLNDLDKVIAKGSAGDFFAKPSNYAIAFGALAESPTTGTFPEDLTKRWEEGKFTSASKLSPRLKRIFSERVDESKDKNFAKKYSELAKKLTRARVRYNLAKKKGDEEQISALNDELEGCAEEIVNVIIDRLIAVDLLAASFNSAILVDLKKAAERYEKIKAAQLKANPELKFDADSPKYRDYYDPEDDTDNIDDMYKVLKASIDKLPTTKMVEMQLMIPKSVNIPDKRYTDDEVKKLYTAYKGGGDNALYELLATPEFKKLRPKKS